MGARGNLVVTSLLGAGASLWWMSRTRPPVDPVREPAPAQIPGVPYFMETNAALKTQEADALRAEIAALKIQIAGMKEDEGVKQSVYQAMLEQAQKNLLSNPLAMGWEDFYRVSESMHVDENTLIQNILLKLEKEAGLSPQQRRDVLQTLYEERGRTERIFKERHVQAIESGMLNLSGEQSQAFGDEILKIRTEVRKGYENRYQTLLQEAQLRLVYLHLRNDFTLGFTSDGNVLGGVGLPEANFKLLAKP